MRYVLPFLAISMVLGSAVIAAPTQKEYQRAIEIPLKAQAVPKQILPLVNLSRNQKIVLSYSFFDTKTRKTIWLVFKQAKAAEPSSASALVILERQLKGKKIFNRRVNVFRGFFLPSSITKLFWFNAKTKEGFTLQMQDVVLGLYTFPKGFESQEVLAQSFLKQGEGLGVTDFLVKYVDEKGFLMVTESPGLIGDGGVEYSAEIPWIWNGREWKEDKENTKVLMN